MIADMRLAGVDAKIDPAVDHLERPADPRAQRVGMRRIDPRHLVCRQQPERRFARPEGTERGVARRKGGARVAHLRIVVALRPAEVTRIDAAAVPRELIAIGRARILAAAERRMTLGMLLLLPLVTSTSPVTVSR